MLLPFLLKIENQENKSIVEKSREEVFIYRLICGMISKKWIYERKNGIYFVPK